MSGRTLCFVRALSFFVFVSLLRWTIYSKNVRLSLDEAGPHQRYALKVPVAAEAPVRCKFSIPR